MATINFVDGTTLIPSSWLNDVDELVYVTYDAHVTAFNAHTADVSNPHSVTKTQVSLGNVSDDAQLKIASNLSDVASATTSRMNLGVEIGVDVQTEDATLTSIAALGTAADRIAYTTGVDVWAETPLTMAARTVLDDTTIGAMRTTLDVYSKAESDNLGTAFSENLVKVIHPDESKGLQELQAQGVYPSSFNQLWGGMGFGGLPDGTLGEAATGCILNNAGTGAVGNVVANTYRAQGFKVGQTTDLASVWIFLYKTGDPTNNLTLEIWSDTAGDPNAIITNGAATAQDGHLHTDNTDGAWVKFVFGTDPNLTGGTQYHIVLQSSGAVDSSNYWVLLTGSDYPHGDFATGDATPVWTPSAGTNFVFLIEPVTTIMTSGLTGFDGATLGYEGSDLNQSGGFYFKNSDLNHKRGTIHLAGTGWDKDKTFLDSGLGTDINRIVLRCNVTTGYAQVDLYENDENKLTIVATSVDISSGNHTVGIRYRAEGDGSDFLTLYVDGVSNGTALTSQTITLDRAFEDGHTTVSGGFPIAPTWTDNEDMSVLPSSSGWTFAGAATEADVFAVSGNILYQNGAGYAATADGYYANTTTFDNSTGYIVETLIKVKESTNLVTDDSIQLRVQDDTVAGRDLSISFCEYFAKIVLGGTDYFVQHNFLNLSTVTVRNIGDDAYVYIDGRLVFDGTGLNTTATTTNQIRFGDSDVGSGDNGTAEWHYVKYFEGVHLPEYSTLALSELAIWNADKSVLLPDLYNSGTILSVKSQAGMNENFVKKVNQVIEVDGIITAVSTTSTTPIPLDDMSVFCFSNRIAVTGSSLLSNTTAGVLSYLDISMDGNTYVPSLRYYESSNNNDRAEISVSLVKPTAYGLHFIQGLYYASGGTTSALATYRTFKVEAE